MCETKGNELVGDENSGDLELRALSQFVSRRNEELAKMERLSVRGVAVCLFTVEFGEVWGYYNHRIVIGLEDLRRHIAAMRAWALVINDVADANLKSILIRDYAQPLVSSLIDIPQSINNQINQACVRLNVLRSGSSVKWKEMKEVAAKLRNGLYEKALETALECDEWSALQEALNVIHLGEAGRKLCELHGRKYHDSLTPPFVCAAKPVGHEVANGVSCFGFQDDSLDHEQLIDAAEEQLKNCLHAYRCFYAYAEQLQRVCIENEGGEYID